MAEESLKEVPVTVCDSHSFPFKGEGSSRGSGIHVICLLNLWVLRLSAIFEAVFQSNVGTAKTTNRECQAIAAAPKQGLVKSLGVNTFFSHERGSHDAPYFAKMLRGIPTGVLRRVWCEHFAT